MASLSRSDIIKILKSSDPDIFNELLNTADRTRQEYCGDKVYLRGLIEFSSYCECNCLYCGLRKNNQGLKRYHLSNEEIIALAMQAFKLGYQSICLQSGETKKAENLDFLVKITEKIKDLSQKADSTGLGLGITLCIGELNYQEYKRLWDAGAHRYLLRIESSDPVLFRKIHPPSQSYEKRLECLHALKDIGFQLGTGVMIGLPGQTAENLCSDLEFFQHENIDMLGMGPYIPHHAAPLSRSKDKQNIDPYTAALKMIALSRLLMPDINIVNSTALQSINPEGLNMGLRAGANIVMPVLTPKDIRSDYYLYEKKKHQSPISLIREIQNAGFTPGLWEWGDPIHYFKKNKLSS